MCNRKLLTQWALKSYKIMMRLHLDWRLMKTVDKDAIEYSTMQTYQKKRRYLSTYLGKNGWTELLIKEFHQKLFHAVSSQTLSQIRNRYWIPQGRTIVRKVIHHCDICRKNHGGPFKMPKVSPWPEKG